MKVKTKYYEYGKNPKCPLCNWDTCVLFWLGQRHYGDEKWGLCGECFAQFLTDEKAKITLSKRKRK